MGRFDAAIFSLVNEAEGRLLSTGAQAQGTTWRAENRTINFEGEVDFCEITSSSDWLDGRRNR